MVSANYNNNMFERKHDLTHITPTERKMSLEQGHLFSFEKSIII